MIFLILALTVAIISIACLRTRRRRGRFTLGHTVGDVTTTGQFAGDGGDERHEDGVRKEQGIAIYTPSHRHTWSSILHILQVIRKTKLFDYFGGQFVPRLHVPRQRFRDVQLDRLAWSVLQGVHTRNELQGAQPSLDVISHSPSEGHPVRRVEGMEHRYLRLNGEEDPNSAPESASGTDQDFQVVVQY